MRPLFFFVFLTLFVFIAPSQAMTPPSTTATMVMANALDQNAFAFQPDKTNSVARPRIASADLGTDGTSELIFGAGRDSEPTVSIYRQDGSFIRSFLAYDAAFKGGVVIALCDFNGTGQHDIVTGAQADGGAHMRSFDGFGNTTGTNFFAYEHFNGGVEIACGDVNGDGLDEIITVPSAGGGPHVKVFSKTGELMHEYFALDASYNGGLTVASTDINNDGIEEIITATAGVNHNQVYVHELSTQAPALLSTFAIPQITGGLFVQAFNDGTNNHIAVTPQWQKEAKVYIYNANGKHQKTLSPFASTEELGIVIAQIPDAENKNYVALSLPRKVGFVNGKYIYVDISEQKLYAFTNGVLDNSFLISTGRKGKDTPQGITEVTDKLLWHDYRWYYGPNDSRNYNIPNVKYNLRFRQYYYIHYAYWHRNFGQQMSSGCVNVNFENAEWIYYWSEVGTPVEIAM